MTETITLEKKETKEKLTNGKFLVLINDEYNTFEWVITSLMDVCKHSKEEAEKSANTVHNEGKCDVYRGESSVLMSMKLELQLRGLTVEIQEDK